MSKKSLHETAAKESFELHEWFDAMAGIDALTPNKRKLAVAASVAFIARECGVSKRRAKRAIQTYL